MSPPCLNRVNFLPCGIPPFDDFHSEMVFPILNGSVLFLKNALIQFTTFVVIQSVSFELYIYQRFNRRREILTVFSDQSDLYVRFFLGFLHCLAANRIRICSSYQMKYAASLLFSLRHSTLLTRQYRSANISHSNQTKPTPRNQI